MNLLKLKPKDHVVFRCGGWAEVKGVTQHPKQGNVDIFFQGEALAHNYLKHGADHERGQSLFDIVEVVSN